MPCGSESRRGGASRQDPNFPPPPTVRSAHRLGERDLGWHVDLRRVTQGRVKDKLVNPAGLVSPLPTPDRLDRAQRSRTAMHQKTRSRLFRAHGRILEPHRFAARALLVASEEVRYLANGLAEGVTFSGPSAVARAAAETSGCAFWLLEPRLGLEERASRLLGLRIRSARELERTHRQARLPGIASDCGETQVAVRRDADALGLSIVIGDWSIRVGSVSVPGYTALADQVLQNAGGIGFYGGWSGSAHGQGWAINQSFGPTVPEGEVGRLNSNRRAVWGTFAGAYSAVAIAFERLGRMAGPADRDGWRIPENGLGLRAITWRRWIGVTERLCRLTPPPGCAEWKTQAPTASRPPRPTNGNRRKYR